MGSSALKLFISLLEQFEAFHSGPDLLWYFYFKEKRKWHHIFIQKYKDTYYFSQNGEQIASTEKDRNSSDPEDFAKNWLPHLKDWMKKIKVDPIKSQSQLFKSLPMSIRYGVLPRRDVNFLLPQWHNFSQELNSKQIKRLVRILEHPEPEPTKAMTLKRYLEYCRIAYEANPKTFKNFDFKKGLTGLEYYKKFADGRCGGLSDIDPNNEEEFDKWFTSSRGDHPWEIYRGGNSTHINLFVEKEEKGGWKIGLEAFSSTRLIETCRIALALDKVNLPFYILHSKSYLKRLRGEDLVGIVPEGSGIKYAWQDFPKEWDVADCIYLDWILEGLDPKKRISIKKTLSYLIHWVPEKISAHLK